MESGNHEYKVNQFLRLSALTLLVIYSVVETQYRVITPFEIIQYPVPRIPYFPYFSISFVSFGWYPVFLETFFYCSMLFLFMFPNKKWARAAAFTAITTRLLSSHLGTGVHLTTFYLVPIFLAWASSGEDDAAYDKLRRRIVTALACMYFFSAVLKLNAHYLSGDVLRWDSIIRYSTKAFLSENGLFPLIVWSGLILELIGSLLFVGRLRRIALISIMTFHFAVTLSITWSFRLQVSGASLLLLFLNQTRARKYFNLVALTLAFHAISQYLLYLGAMKWFPAFINQQLQDTHGIVFATVLYILSISFILTQEIDSKTVWSRGAALVCAVYALCAVAFSWPEPFGYTQYSGLARNYYGVSVDDKWRQETKPFDILRGRWSFRLIPDLFENETTYLFTFKSSQKKLVDFICERDPTANYTLIHSDRPLNIEPSDPNRSKAFESFLKSRKKMACTPDRH